MQQTCNFKIHHLIEALTESVRFFAFMLLKPSKKTQTYSWPYSSLQFVLPSKENKIERNVAISNKPIKRKEKARGVDEKEQKLLMYA